MHSIDRSGSGKDSTGDINRGEFARGLRILVNNAGYLGSYKPFEQFDAAEWERILRVNLIGVFEVTRHIVNMGSLAGKEGLPNLAAYSAASAGVIAFTKALST